ncbi:MAG: hypothetical protein P4L28_08165 [Paludibacteraceae bacterium]|nr:hypothetical protein [Paludibacteraceae bacterium]
MKKQIFLLAIFIIILSPSQNSLFANTLFANSLANTEFLHKNTIDTIHILPAIGCIKCSAKSKIIPNDSLNHIFLTRFKKIIQSTTNKYAITYENNDTTFSLAATEYLVNVIPKFENISEDAFSEIGIGSDLENLLKKQKGRYFGIVFYQGNSTPNMYPEIVVGAVVGGLAGGLLAGVLFSNLPSGNSTNLATKMVIIDKQTRHFIFYTNDERQRSPIEEKTIFKTFSSIFKDLYSNSKH